MPSLRKRVSSYFRQLSFYNEPRDKKHNINENSFITKYLEGHIHVREGPSILYGKNPTDLPNYSLASYDTGPETLIGCFSGPNGGLTAVKRLEKHLSIPDTDIDFIDIQDEPEEVPVSNTLVVEKSPQKAVVDNMTMLIKVAGQEYLVTNRKKPENKSNSLASLSDLEVEIEKTKKCANNNNEDVKCKNQENQNLNETKTKVDKHVTLPYDKKAKIQDKVNQDTRRKSSINQGLSKSKSEGNPFQHKKKGKIIKITNRATTNVAGTANINSVEKLDLKLPNIWNRSSDHFYGISDSLYDTNQVTKIKNGDPIADCFGIIARKDSAILAVADGVNWGEKASVAAKSAIHGSLHYLNKTIFNDTKSFDDLVGGSNQKSPSALNHNKIANTREVFVCLLRAFHCAHDLILENEGMLTTLTVAVILPLNPRNGRPTRSDSQQSENSESYICCVCNVGDTLAYIYSQKYGVRELTKGSHDINLNRDMRDALGALGPVDGINPELSNLTLSITIAQKGDIILVASDGLTDNFDSNVCKFTVNTKDTSHQTKPKRPSTASNAESRPKWDSRGHHEEKRSEAPVKPPRKNKDSVSRSSRERSVDSLKGKLASDSSTQTLTDEVKSEPVPNTKPKPLALPDELDNPLVAQFLRENSLDEKENCEKPKEVLQPKPSTELRRKTSSASKESSSQLSTSKSSHHKSSYQHDKPHLSNKPSNKHISHHKQHELRRSTSRGRDLSATTSAPATTNTGGFMRSKTSLDMRTNKKTILRNEDGIPFVTPLQRYEISLLLMEDVLKHGISGHDLQCTTAKKVCENLVNFTYSISAAKRHTLEDTDLYFDNINGVLVEVSQHEKKSRRRRGLEKVQNLPGKLDHVTVVGYNVGNFASIF